MNGKPRRGVRKLVEADSLKVGWRARAGAVTTTPGPPPGRRYGMTATAVCSASADPPTVLACINRLATTHGAVAKSKAFCVNVLRAEDWELSSTFSGSQSGDARFKSRDWTRLATRPPGLVDALGAGSGEDTAE